MRNAVFLSKFFKRAISIAFFLTFILYSQELIGQFTFEKLISRGGVSSLIIKAENGYYAAGADDTSHLWLYKLSNNGDSLWGHYFGNVGMLGGTYPTDLELTSDGKIIIVGNDRSFSSTRDIYIVKTDTLGNKIWDKSLHLSNESKASSINETPDGFYLITGQYNNNGNDDVVIIKMDTSGAIIWQNTYLMLGDESASELAVFSDNRFFICGNSVSGTGDINSFLFEIDSTGHRNWLKTYGDSLNNIFNSMVITRDSNLLMSGYTNSTQTVNNDIWVLKTNLVGDTIWTQVYGDSSKNENIFSITLSDSAFYFAGRSTTLAHPVIFSAIILALDTSGGELWLNEFSQSDYFNKILFDNRDNSIVSSGRTLNFGDQNFYILKVGTNGLLNSIINVTVEKANTIIFPNPTEGGSNIFSNSFSKLRSMHVQIFNEFGNKLREQEVLLEQDQFRIDLSLFPPGIYIVKFYYKNQHSNLFSFEVLKIVKL